MTESGCTRPVDADADAAAGNPPAVLMLSAFGGIGGAERVMLNLIRSLRGRARFGVASLQDGPLLDAARQAGAEQTWVCPWPEELAGLGESVPETAIAQAIGSARLLATRSSSVLKTVRFINDLIRRFRPHILHSNGVKTHLLSAWISCSSSRLVWHLHDFVSRRAVSRHMLPLLARRVDRLIAVSRAVEADARSVVPPTTKIEVVYNGIDTDHFSPPTHRRRSGPVRVGLVATYARWKGQDVFIDAVARLPADLRAAGRFRIVGGPIYATRGSQWSREELRSRAEARGVASDIEFDDFQADPLRAYHDLDVVVHASTQPEPFGLTIVEAMSCGRAVIAAQAGGAAELFEHEVDALGTPPGDADALASAMTQLIASQPMRNRLGSAARRRAVERFSLELMGSEMQRIYRELLD